MPPAKTTAKKRTAGTGRTTPKKTQPRVTARQVQIAIRKNEFTPTQIMDIYRECAETLTNGAVGVRWKIKLPPPIGVEFDEDDLTMAELEWVERRTRTPAVSLSIKQSGEHLLSVIASHLIHTHEWDETEALKMVGQIPVNEAFEMVEDVVVSPDPKGRSGYVSVLGT